jgi:hypothetical protein
MTVSLEPTDPTPEPSTPSPSPTPTTEVPTSEPSPSPSPTAPSTVDSAPSCGTSVSTACHVYVTEDVRDFAGLSVVLIVFLLAALLASQLGRR